MQNCYVNNNLARQRARIGEFLDCRWLCLSSLAHNKHSCNSAILNLFLLPICHPRSSRFTMQVILFNNTYLLWKATMQKIHRTSSKRIFIHLSHKGASWSLPPHFLGREYDTPPTNTDFFPRAQACLAPWTGTCKAVSKLISQGNNLLFALCLSAEFWNSEDSWMKLDVTNLHLQISSVYPGACTGISGDWGEWCLTAHGQGDDSLLCCVFGHGPV